MKAMIGYLRFPIKEIDCSSITETAANGGEAGLIHAYFGEGKGKTTAAVGMTVRAAGSGLRVVFAQFLKGDASGERAVLKGIPGVVLINVPHQIKFTFLMDEKEKNDTAELCGSMLSECSEISEDADMIVLDELFGAIEAGLVSIDAAVAFVKEHGKSVELVMTGRVAPPDILELCDYVTEMRSIRHPYEKGADARRGIEF